MTEFYKIDKLEMESLWEEINDLVNFHCGLYCEYIISNGIPCSKCKGHDVCALLGELEDKVTSMMDNDIYPKKARLSYREYLQTDHWKETRKNALKRAYYKCQLCSTKGNLHVHHNNYDNLWKETDKDIIVLCDECHAKFHGKDVNQPN